MKKECDEEVVQPYRKTDYKPIIYIYIIYNRNGMVSIRYKKCLTLACMIYLIYQIRLSIVIGEL